MIINEQHANAIEPGEHGEEVLRELAMRDGLTGLYNRREMQRILKEEVERYIRYERPCALIMADLDHFKSVNDTHGHLVGSKLLAEVGYLIKSHLRLIDYAFRYGGDEFLVIMPETDLVQAGVAIERLNQLVERWNGKQQRDYTLSLSCGVSSYTGQLTVEELLTSADADLYVQKANREGSPSAPKTGQLRTPRL